MKLQPPVVEIPDDDPYHNDLFQDRQQFGNSLTSLLTSLDESVVLCIDAPWGDGKTTFANMWITDLKRKGKNCIYFDAYEHDYSDDPFVSFSAEIISLAETAFAGNDIIKTLKEDFKTKAMRVGGKLLQTGTRIGIKALALGALQSSDLEELVGIKDDIASNTSGAISSLVGKAFEEYAESKGTLKEFREKLSALGKAVREAQGFPLLIIVDELDRCRPDFALALIERIKHLFSANEVSFVLLVNMEQLQNYVKTIYGAEVDAKNYLHKFFSLVTALPRNQEDSYNNRHHKYGRKLIAHFGLDDQRDLDSGLMLFSQHFDFSLREMERCLSSLVPYYAQLQKGWFSIDAVIVFLAVLRMRLPEVYSRLAAGRISYDELIRQAGVEDIDLTKGSSFSSEWFLGLLKFFLLSEEQYKALSENDEARQWSHVMNRYSMRDRTKVIPFFCSELNRFKVKSE